MYKMPWYTCTKRETVDIKLAIAFSNGGSLIRQTLRITKRFPTRVTEPIWQGQMNIFKNDIYIMTNSPSYPLLNYPTCSSSK